jgi:hypothetical protein
MNKADISFILCNEELPSSPTVGSKLVGSKATSMRLTALHAPNFVDRDPSGRLSDLASFKQGILD